MGSARLLLPVLTIVTVVVFAGPSIAFANTPPPPPPGTPSIGQYVETVPTAQGGSAAGAHSAAGREQRAVPLPTNVTKALSTQSGAVAKRLEVIATSSAYGAPQIALRPSHGGPTPEALGASNSALSAAISAASGSGDSHLFWLLGAVIVITTAMVWTVRQRR